MNDKKTVNIFVNSQIIKILFFCLISVSVYGEDYYTYNLFNNFNIVSPKNLTRYPESPMGIEMYHSSDQSGNIVFTIKYSKSGFKHDIGEYRQSVKKDIDSTLIAPEEQAGYKVTHFSSNLNKNKNMYTATIFSTPNNEGEYAFKATKYIIYGKKSYSWTVMSYDKNNVQTTFENYKNHISIQGQSDQ